MQIINKLYRYNDVYINFILKVILIIFFSTTFLQANTFKVSDIEVSSPFELNFDKNKVLNDGFRSSFHNLISTITTSGDRNKIKDISLRELKGMIDSFTISEERFVNDEYFAKLEVIFNKKNTLNFLERKNIFPSIPIRNKVLLVPILVDLEKDKIFLFNDNIFYQRWNDAKKKYYLLEYLLPSEDLEDLNDIQQNFKFIEDYDFLKLIKKYDLNDYVVVILFKSKNQLKVHSKINLQNSFKVNNQVFEDIDLNDEKNFESVIVKLKTIYEDYWKKKNEINTSIRLPLTISINSKEYVKIQKLEKTLNNLNLVSNFYILRFDNTNIYFKIIYNGSPKTFLNDMSINNFDLSIENNVWTIR
ncbi:MAG: hypothetical protein CBC66_002830 [Candidatus Pelagibacter sp. TMED106]|nr:MAG: hypothetical protein CBC66_002830 [Candidatus Pelagibacter sp. TMED106]|tara:strand:- start:2670 stop:3749 length:1080 start_codon:yes stop_codon:yes gene_type:complete